MPQHNDDIADASPMPALPIWLRHPHQHAPDRLAKMLDHMARVRSLPDRQATLTTPAPERSSKAGAEFLGDGIGHIVLFGVIALLFQSRVPLYLGAFLFLTDGERIESALGHIGIRFEPGTIGPDIFKGFVFWFGWFALLASVRASVPAWLAPWLPPTDSWSLLAGIAVALTLAESVAVQVMRRSAPWFGFELAPGGWIWMAVKLTAAIGALALLLAFFGSR
ncbi:hypothetical protein [Bradyrhizobium yuanmingense]|uniref:hypothetical protein n=1 Tax=Bradyrhizobium yuanmingense TaxID=108015 RepID=UPI0023B8A3F6|nr:hypothetical protein [Bradyrhizobium yuanmingense]MDF0581175.1 hypothetical protein [Bradyrhizobium yuanmingense]